MATRKQRKRSTASRVPRGAVLPTDMAAKIAGEELEDTIIETGPLGNPDYVEHGSEEHKVLVGFDPETDELVYDLTGEEERIAERFERQRRAYVDSGEPEAPPGCPDAWVPADSQ